MKSFNLKINGLRHQFYSWGKSSLPKLFFFHGWMDTGASFNFICEHLQKNFHCIAPDLRGFGKTEYSKNQVGYFFYEYIADAHQMFQKLASDEKIKCIGHSMGGNILSLYAGTFPERISHFINVEGFGIRNMNPEEGPRKMKEWLESSEKDFKTYKNFDQLAERLQENNPNIPKERLRFVVKYMSKKTAKGYQFSSDSRHKWPNPYLYQLENVIQFWKNIQSKCLLVLGEKSEWRNKSAFGENQQESLEKRLNHFPKHSTQALVKECGHMIHLEKPKELSELISNFLLEKSDNP